MSRAFQRGPLTGIGPGPFKSHAREFVMVLGENPRLVKVVDVDAHEGPVYVADEHAVYFTSLPRVSDIPMPGSRDVAIKRIALGHDGFPLTPARVSVFRPQANGANGMALDVDGQLMVCEQGSRSQHARISRIDRRSGAIETVVDEWSGLRLNSPNDVVVKSDGSVWFTDPSYGHLQGFRPEPVVGDYVYRHDPRTGRTAVVADSFDKPNGIAFSADERVLYITDSGANQEPGSYHVARPHHIIAYDVTGGGHLVNGRLFAVTSPGFPDGIKVDTESRVYSSAFSGVQVFAPGGDLIGEIALPGTVNFTFGGREGNTLFITTDTALYAAMLNARGATSNRTEVGVETKGRMSSGDRTDAKDP